MEPSAHLASLNVLLVDDSPEFRELIRAYLKPYPFTVTEVEDGEAALLIMKENHFDLVLMDIKMPIMDGITSTRKFRQWENEKRHLPILALSAFSMREERELCMSSGFDGFIAKPIRKMELVESLMKHVAFRF